MKYIIFIYLITGMASAEVWDDYPSSLDKYLNQNSLFKTRFNQISKLQSQSYKLKPTSYEKINLERDIRLKSRALKNLIIRNRLNTGPYKAARNNVDLAYHGVYSVHRQRLQDKIIAKYIRQFSSFPKYRGKPLVIYSAGVGGVGKGFAISKLRECGFFRRKFITIDPDEIKKELPEFAQAVKSRNLPAKDKAKVSSFVHKESGYIDEIIEAVILSRKGNMIIDGTLQNFEYSRDSMKKYKNNGYNIKVIYITAPKELIYKRVAERAQKTGRDVPRNVLDSMLVTVDQSIGSLKKERGLIDQFIEIDNGSFPTVIGQKGKIPLKAPACVIKIRNQFR